jgi:hypothetical protein
LVDWGNSKWNLENMVEKQVPVDKVCKLPKTQDVLVVEERTVPELQLLCRKLRGKVTVVTSYEMQNQLIMKFKEILPNELDEYGKLSCFYNRQ